ncbi:protein of unknown function [Maridesulfovibrio hydrothermalis AM13 = DSM 14728]|uniref:Uncharacterized protein n=1 Tax=Maridesulfovibrio hydrothermalis AM13 = DSM 14728 TaxID=1121451 RepID=L0RHN6_9BACT|nr:protein of unknown function [Maridesulfovibrio hydrothermalis AM13 = DSM 14728]
MDWLHDEVSLFFAGIAVLSIPLSFFYVKTWLLFCAMSFIFLSQSV